LRRFEADLNACPCNPVYLKLPFGLLRESELLKFHDLQDEALDLAWHVDSLEGLAKQRRIDDLAKELQAQIASLKQQEQAATEANAKLWAENDDLTHQGYADEDLIDDLQVHIDGLEQKEQATTEANQELRASIEGLRQNEQTAKREKQELHAQIDSLKQTEKAATKINAGLQAQVEGLKQKQQATPKTNEELQTHFSDLNKQFNTVTNDVGYLRLKLVAQSVALGTGAFDD